MENYFEIMVMQYAYNTTIYFALITMIIATAIGFRGLHNFQIESEFGMSHWCSAAQFILAVISLGLGISAVVRLIVLF